MSNTEMIISGPIPMYESPTDHEGKPLPHLSGWGELVEGRVTDKFL